MLSGPADLPKPARELPEAAQTVFLRAYNADFAWKAQEAHALKAAWRAVRAAFTQADGAWVEKR
jgi:cation transport regulator ChaB